MGEKYHDDLYMNGRLSAFETMPVPCLVLSPQFTILTASDDYLAITSKSREEITGKYLFDVFPEVLDKAAVNGGIADSLQQVLQTKQHHQLPVTRFDVVDITGTLTEKHWDTAHKPVLHATGEIDYIIHYTRDVTHQVTANRQMKASLQNEVEATAKAAQLSSQMEKLFNEIPVQIAIVSGKDMVYEYINPQYKKELFLNRDVLGMPLLAAVPEVRGAPVWDILQKVFSTGQTATEKELCIPLADESGGALHDHYFNLIYQPIRDINGEVTSILSFKYEITELVLARKRFEDSKTALMALNEELATANEELQAASEEIQVGSEEIQVANEELRVASEEIQSANEELTAINEDLYVTRENLRSLNLELESRVEKRTQELAIAQADAEGQRDKLKRFFMQAPAGICILDGPDLAFELVNPTYQQLFPGRNLVGKKLLEALPELAGQPIEDVLKNVYTTGVSFVGNELLIPLSRTTSGPVEDRYFDFVYQARHDAEGAIDGILAFVIEVTEKVNTRQKEKAAEERFRFLLNAIPQQVWTATPDGALDYVNAVVCSDFGQNQQQIVGQGWQEFIHPKDLSECLTRWVASLQTGSEYVVEFRLKFSDGSYRWHLARAVPLIENGQITLWLGTNTNIDTQKNNEQKKDEFLSIASHELKTPLTSIKAFNQLMQKMNDPAKLTSFASKTAMHIGRLEKLITDLLDVTRINSGKIAYNMERFAFEDMLTECIDAVQYSAPYHQIIVQANPSVQFTGDRFRLEQVLNNLLTNAIKYSPDVKEVIVTSTIQDNNIVVSVQDFGIGIEEKNIHRLFERYYRVDNTAMRFEGLGLGLFISAEILQRHGGNFHIKSQIGKGSTFSFTLPLN